MKKTLDEQIEVMMHFRDGGEIEYNYNGDWKPCVKPYWNWVDIEHRIKRVPKEYWINIYNSGVCYNHTDEIMAKKNLGETGKTIRVIEVLNDGDA